MSARDASTGNGTNYLMDGGADTAQNEHTPEFLKELQAMPLEAKIMLTRARIDEFYTGYNTIGYGNAYVSFSGGKDSTVLLDIARKRYPEIPAVFSNTGLEYPEIQRFAKAHDNVEVVYPKLRFDEVISKYGYPLIGKEIAEAIYYARRMQPDKRERERERERSSALDIIAQKPQNRTGWCIPVYTNTLNGARDRNSKAHGSETNGIQRETAAKRTSRGRREIPFQQRKMVAALS